MPTARSSASPGTTRQSWTLDQICAESPTPQLISPVKSASTQPTSTITAQSTCSSRNVAPAAWNRGAPLARRDTTATSSASSQRSRPPSLRRDIRPGTPAISISWLSTRRPAVKPSTTERKISLADHPPACPRKPQAISASTPSVSAAISRSAPACCPETAHHRTADAFRPRRANRHRCSPHSLAKRIGPRRVRAQSRSGSSHRAAPQRLVPIPIRLERQADEIRQRHRAMGIGHRTAHQLARPCPHRCHAGVVQNPRATS